MKHAALWVVAAAVLSGCAAPTSPDNPEYNKTDRLQAQLDQMIVVRDSQRASLKTATSEADIYRLRSAILTQNSLIADIRRRMGQDPGPREPIEENTLSAAIADTAGSQTEGPPQVTSESSEFSKFIKLQAPATKLTTGRYGTTQWTPSAMVNKEDGSISYYVHFYEIYTSDSWKFWSLASTAKSETLPVTKLSSKVVSCRGGCLYSEEISVDLPTAIAERSTDEQLRVQLRGRGAAPYVFSVPPIYFKQLVARAREESAQYTKEKTTAGYKGVEALKSRPSPFTPSAADELQKLGKLKADGLITEKEFQRLKSKLILGTGGQ